MFIPYRIITSILGLLIAVTIIYLVRKDRLHPLYTLWWFFIAFCIGFFGLFPTVADIIGRGLKIAYPPVFILIVANILLFLKLLMMDIERSENKRQIRKLSQIVALLRYEVERFKKKDS